jgi:hypothetical protein
MRTQNKRPNPSLQPCTTGRRLGAFALLLVGALCWSGCLAPPTEAEWMGVSEPTTGQEAGTTTARGVDSLAAGATEAQPPSESSAGFRGARDPSTEQPQCACCVLDNGFLQCRDIPCKTRCH